MVNLLPVIYEDNHLLVINKPCGLATMGASPGTDSVAKLAASYIKKKFQKPGNVYVGIVSRLDAAVSGVLVLARTSKAASRLSEQIRRQLVTKRYLAIVEGQPNRNGLCQTGGYSQQVHYLKKNEALQRVQSVSPSTTGAQKAMLRLRLIRDFGSCSLVEIDLVTGRKHQIRVQLSALGHPVRGDKKYGAGSQRVAPGWSNGIGLHCYRVTLEHPTQQESLTFRAMPGHWSAALKKLGCGPTQFDELCRDLDGQEPCSN